jgi:hypothetical protein
MSTSFSLNVPTDIPWRRVCVTRSMLDPVPCDAERPPRWKPSIAVFRYDPADEYQPFQDQTVSYLKVVVTVAPFVSELGIDQAEDTGLPVLLDDLEEAFPCYGALVHVTTGPRDADKEKFKREQYPYFIDFEPKRRELYETVTDTGEVLSGSSNTLSVGKNAVSSNTTENYNLDTGWNFGMQASYAGTGGGHNAGATGQWGSVNRTGLENTNVRTSESSTERRELQSHVTQLAQMYNLFQAFHLGTNRALFFLEPRPHIRQSESTFINGPRALEGLQEIFLVTVRPKAMADFCVGVTLETAHLSKTPNYASATKDDLFDEFRLFAKAENRDTSIGQDEFVSNPISLTSTYYAPAGWEITGYEIQVRQAQRVSSGPTVTYTASTLTVYGEVTWRFWESGYDAAHCEYPDHYEDGILNVDIVIHLRQVPPVVTEYVKSLFLHAHSLCCCDEYRESSTPDPSVVFSVDLQHLGHGYKIHQGLASAETFEQSRTLASAIRTQMVRSLGSSRRKKVGEVPYFKSDVFHTRVVDVLAGRRMLRDLSTAVKDARVLSREHKEQLAGVSDASLARVLSMDALTLGLQLGISEAEVTELKSNVLRAIGRRFKDKANPARRAVAKKKKG